VESHRSWFAEEGRRLPPSDVRASRLRGRDGLEDLLDCPFRDLCLLEQVPDESRTYRWVLGAKASLAPEIVAYASLEYMADEGVGATMTLTRLATGVGGPGRVFKLPEAALFEALSVAAATCPQFTLATQGGIRQLTTISGAAATHAVEILEGYYTRTTGSSVRLSDRPLVDVLRQYEEVAAILEVGDDDRIRELELRQRRIDLAEELRTAGLAV